MLYAIIGLATVVLAAVVVLLLRWRRRRNAGPVSIVMLRNSARNFSEADIRAAFRRVHKRDPQIQRVPFDEHTSGFLIVDEELPPIAIIDSRRQYADPADLEETASHHDHPVLRDALLNHRAWVSVDAMGVNGAVPKQDQAMIHGLRGPIAAQLLDAGTMLLFLPAEKNVAEPGPDTEEQLREGRIAELFSDENLVAPLFHVDKDDPRINAAMAEARSRLPEFCAEFDRRGTACEAMVKARFAVKNEDEESAEFMWVKVESMDASGFTGTVANHPVDPSLPAKGATVKVKIDDVVDWAYLDEQEEPQGVFVDRILMGRAP